VLKRERERDFSQTNLVPFCMEVVSVTLMSATMVQAGSVPCQCVMSPNEGELPVPRPVSTNELLNKSVLVPPLLSPGPTSIPFQFTYPPMSLCSRAHHLTLSPYAHNEPSRPPSIPFQYSLSDRYGYLFVGQPVFPMLED